MGYRRPNDRGANYKKYTQYKNRVLLLAMEKGWHGRAVAVKDPEVYLSVFIKWKKAPRSDWSNIIKAVEDALFEQDRYVKPGRFGMEWDTGVEEAMVSLVVL